MNKDRRQLDVSIAQNATQSASFQFGSDSVPIAFDTPSGWTTCDVTLQVDVGASGSPDWRTLWSEGSDYILYGVAAGKRVALDPKAVANLLDGRPLRLVCSVAQTNAVTVTVYGAARLV